MEYIVRDRRTGREYRSFFSADGWRYAGVRRAAWGYHVFEKGSGWNKPQAEFREDLYSVGMGCFEMFGPSTLAHADFGPGPFLAPQRAREEFLTLGSRVRDALEMGENQGYPQDRVRAIEERATRAELKRSGNSPFIADQLEYRNLRRRELLSA